MGQTIRLFTPADLRPDQSVALDPGQAHYIANVMRRQVGETIELFNGRDGEWAATLEQLDKKRALATPRHQTRPQTQAGKHAADIILCFAPVKRAPLDQIAQKATELGVCALQPVFTERTIVTRVKEERLLANVIEAAEQTERLDVPTLLPPLKLAGLIAHWKEQQPDRRLIFCDEALADGSAAPPMQTALEIYKEKALPWAILIGPEGGFSDAERELLRSQDFITPVRLGANILRADTAAFAALALWQSILGNW